MGNKSSKQDQLKQDQLKQDQSKQDQSKQNVLKQNVLKQNVSDEDLLKKCSAQILHKLVINNDPECLDITLGLMTEPIVLFHGMSLFHTFVVGSAFYKNYKIFEIFEILKKYKHIVGEPTCQHIDVKNFVFHTWMKHAFDTKTKKYTDVNIRKCVIINFMCMTATGEYDEFSYNDKICHYTDELGESQGFRNHLKLNYDIPNYAPLSPLLLALCLRSQNTNYIITANTKKVIDLLAEIEKERALPFTEPPHYDSIYEKSLI